MINHKKIKQIDLRYSSEFFRVIKTGALRKIEMCIKHVEGLEEDEK